MKDKGVLILLSLFLIFLFIYFKMFGFSYLKHVRIGQYAGIATIIYFWVDEMFKD